MERITKFYPAWDKRDPDPSKNYGIHGVDLRMVLKGTLGAVQFILYTNWMTKDYMNASLSDPTSISYKRDGFWKFVQVPMPADLGFHSPKPMYEGHHPIGSTRPIEELKQIQLKEELGLNDLKITLPEVEPVKSENIPVCEYLGCPCYYDGSTLASEAVFDILIEKGSDGVWEYLEKYYIDIFGKLE